MSTTHCRAAIAAVLAAMAGAIPLNGQASFFRPMLFGSPSGNAIRVQGVSAYFGYTSLATSPTGAPNAISDYQGGGSVAIGWNRSGARGGLSGVYSLSYAGSPRYPETNSLNHALSVSATRELGPRWSFAATAAGTVNNLAQYLFAPTESGFLASSPGSADDLAGAVLGGTSGAGQTGSLLTGAPAAESPARGLIYGDRVLTAMAGVTLTWRGSPRLQVEFAAGANRNQGLSSEREEAVGQSFVAHSTSANASAGVSYSLSPRMQVGVQGMMTRTSSPLQDAYTGTGVFSAGGKLTRSLFVDGRAGVSVIRSLRSTFGLSQQPHFIAGGTLGYRERSHTLLASLDRTASSSYGLVADSSISANGAWNWRPPGGRWSLFCQGGQQRMRSYSVEIDGWVFQAGFGRSLNRHLWLESSYGYVSNTGQVVGPWRGLARHSVRLQIAWNPASEAAR